LSFLGGHRSDRATIAMRNYASRLEATKEAIESNPGIEVNELCAKLSLVLKVKPETVERYVLTLAEAKQLHADLGHLYTVEGWETKKDLEKLDALEQEQKVIEAAKEKGSSPLEGYDTEAAEEDNPSSAEEATPPS
jgi:hypothetical protein